MAIIDTLKIYESLKAQMPDRSAKAVTEVLELSFEEYRVNQREFLATKQDLTELRAEIKQDLAAHQAATDVNFARMRTEIAGVRSELIKWMFLFWVGQIGVTVTFLLTLR